MGGSGQVLRAAFWYHSVRLRCHHALVARRLLRLQFCVWVSAAVTRPGIPVPGLSVCALPSSFHPSPTPPAPPFRGSGRGGVGRWILGWGRMSVMRPGWRWPMRLLGCSPESCRDTRACTLCIPSLRGSWVEVSGSPWPRRCVGCISAHGLVAVGDVFSPGM
jgi:hypothetical protein